MLLASFSVASGLDYHTSASAARTSLVQVRCLCSHTSVGIHKQLSRISLQQVRATVVTTAQRLLKCAQQILVLVLVSRHRQL